MEIIERRRFKKLRQSVFPSSKFDGTPREVLSSHGNAKISSEKSYGCTHYSQSTAEENLGGPDISGRYHSTQSLSLQLPFPATANCEDTTSTRGGRHCCAENASIACVGLRLQRANSRRLLRNLKRQARVKIEPAVGSFKSPASGPRGL
ncbi:hypothetical protein Tco_0486751 [Tanacetum coccineum]